MFTKDLFYFAQRHATLNEITECLNMYTMDEIQIMIQEKVFDTALYRALEYYFLQRINPS